MTHSDMMNIQIDPEMIEVLGKSRAADYRLGHRDARHTAADIALEQDAKIERLVDALKEAGDVIECYHKNTGIDLGAASMMPFYDDTMGKISAALKETDR